ncbi:MAG: hypothetical protein ACE148_16820 [Vicinamibacterales bacterium]
MPIGLPELLVIVIVALLWFVPIAAGVWVLVTLRALQKGQDAIARRLDEIEQRLPRN